jgi:FtsH-binding integral membrane protein
VAFTTLHYHPLIVAEAACLTASMVVAITIYAATTKTDFTMCGPIFYIFFLVFITAIILGFLFGFVSHLAYCCFGVVLFSFYLIWDI